MTSFFSVPSKTPLPLVPRCGACGLYKGCLTPKMPMYGKGRKGILICAESPGRVEDEQGRPLVGRSGELLRDTLRKFGIEMTQDCWLYNSVICHPKGDKLPEAAIDHCRPNVVSLINQLKPKVIVLLGSSAIKSVIGWTWKGDPGGVARWSGYQIPDRRLNSWICPTYHPSFILRNQQPDKKDPAQVIWERHLEAITKLEDRPWESVPNDSLRIRKCINPDQAIPLLEGMVKAGSCVSFDWETDRLKPDSEESRIVCCAFSDGVTSVAFPWYGPVREKVREILLNPQIRKIGYSAKFEDRWTWKEFGSAVKGWVFDGMLAAHTLDSRRGTKSLKFQSYARLGQESYNDHIEGYLEAKGGNTPNKIRDLPLSQLLEYCAIDALLEHQLAYVLAGELGIKL